MVTDRLELPTLWASTRCSTNWATSALWWEQRDLNSQSFRHMLLRHTCIPIPPYSHMVFPERIELSPQVPKTCMSTNTPRKDFIAVFDYEYIITHVNQTVNSFLKNIFFIYSVPVLCLYIITTSKFCQVIFFYSFIAHVRARV